MKFLIKVMDSIVMQIIWILYVIHRTWIPKKRSEDNMHSISAQFRDDEHKERHFIHLYTTNPYGEKPVCYMDVYKMNSPSDEQKLRDFCSKGVPNKTYLRYQRRKRINRLRHCHPQDWLEYSTIAL